MEICFKSFYNDINIFILLFTIFTSSHCSINNEFKGAKYIKDFKSFNDYQEAFKNNKLKYGFLLIYSNYCPHCMHFSQDFITLSEIFHKDLFFYTAGADHSKYQKEFWIRGFPTILFYNNGSYFEYKKKRSVKKISQFIRNYTQTSCTEIYYENIKTVKQDVYSEDDRNIIIGFFNKEKNINNFCEMTNSLKNGYEDLCYYVIRNETDKKRIDKNFLDMKENEIWANSKKYGDYKFIFNESNYKEILFQNVLNKYEDIYKNEDINLLKRMKDKDFIFFIYDNDKMKEDYIEKINELYDKEKEQNFFNYYYILYNKNINSEKFKNFDKDEIYHVSNDLLNQNIINDLNEFMNDNTKNKNQINKEEKSIKLKEIKSEQAEEKKNLEKIAIKGTIDKEKKNSETVKEVKIDMNEENIPININEKNASEILSDEKRNFEVKNSKNKNFIKKDNLQLNKARKKFNQKKNIIIKNRFQHNNEKNSNTKYFKENLDSKLDKFNDEGEESSNDIVKMLIFFVVIGIAIYIIITKYLCVGFIKVNDNQIIEFNNQPNTIEVI